MPKSLWMLALAGCGTVVDQWEDCGCSGSQICLRTPDLNTCVDSPSECEGLCDSSDACDEAERALCGSATFTASECVDSDPDGFGHVIDCDE